MSDPRKTDSKEIIVRGTPASPGAAIGMAYLHVANEPVVSFDKIEKAKASDHVKLFEKAKKRCAEELQKLQSSQGDEESKNIIEAQIAIIRDPDLSEQIKMLITDKQYSVQQALRDAFEEYMNLFSKSGSPVTANRLIDLSDIRDRLIEAVDNKPWTSVEKKGDILVAEELSPREIIQLSHQGIKGIIMEYSGNSSHSAIIARSLGIPAVVGAKDAVNIIPNNTKVCLDAERGIIAVNPDSDTCKQTQKMIDKQTMSNTEIATICAKPSLTSDGHPFTLRANIEFPEELDRLEQCNAEGIGLLRTESLYLNQSRFGSRPDQQQFYESVLQKTGDRPVTIRLFDVGGDKFQERKVTEDNPFLGWRGIRMLLDERELLRAQLTAILAAAGNQPGKVKILLPMVTTLTEIDEIKKEVKKCTQQLIDEGTAVDENVPLGIMVEIPNVAMRAADFAAKADFFSIGTNDLIQYLLAADRGNARISHLYNQNHPVMWQMIHQTVDAAHQHNITVEVCGELASQPVAAACLLGLKVDGLSMTPSRLPRVKKLLTNRSFNQMEKLAEDTLQCDSIIKVEALFNVWRENKT